MQTLFIAMNARYMHTNLAVAKLSARTPQSHILETNINQNQTWTLQRILEINPQIICFSCYIWNISDMLHLAEDVKKTLPDAILVFGGPEVSFDTEELMQNHPFIDYVCSGEGEVALPALINSIKKGEPITNGAISYRKDGAIVTNTEQGLFDNFASEPFDYADYIKTGKNKILYYESTRGCPFDCAYCLSGALSRNVRKLPLEQIEKDMQIFYENDIKLVKFVDRTFNCDKKRAADIIEAVTHTTGDMRFHFEIGADIIDERTLALLSDAPIGKFQLEAGIQSYNPQTLEAVLRKTDLLKLQSNLKAIMALNNTHLHIDLIAGLPYEGLESFKNSFNQAYAIQPHQLQLGFLKILKGSRLYHNHKEYGIKYRAYPPYEVLQTDALPAADLLLLQGVETLLDRYFNGFRARGAIAYLMDTAFDSAFDFYAAFYQHAKKRGTITRPLSATAQYNELIDFTKNRITDDDFNTFLEKLKLDYLMEGAGGTKPKGMQEVNDRRLLAPEITHLKRQEIYADINLNRCVFAKLNIGGEKALAMADPGDKNPLTQLWQITFFGLPLEE